MVSALSPMRLGQSPQVDLVGSYLSGRQGGQAVKMNDQAIKQNEQNINQADYEKAVQGLSVVNKLAVKARSIASPQEREAFISSINGDMLKSVGVDPAQITQAPRDDQGLDALIAQTNASLEPHRLTGEAASFNAMTKSLSPEDRDEALKIKLRLKSGAVGSAAQTIAEDGLTNKIADSQAVIEGAKEGSKTTSDINARIKGGGRAENVEAIGSASGKAAVELATQPNIERATSDAKNESDATAKAKSVAQKNANALATYEAGIKSVSESLDKTLTGPFIGNTPAITANQQTADGSLAAMAPVLKGLFREAGEGTFTKEDQQILMDMLPTRSDLPEARKAKLKNVDMLIKTKLTTQPVDGQKKGKSKYTIEVMP